MQILETITSAFRGRRRSLADFRSVKPKAKSDKSVNRWAIYKQLCVAKARFGVNDRALAVLSALLSFYPENEICEKHGLVVFPSNKQLSLRAHGMPGSTLRRHIAALVEAGLIARRDSPNGKRYAYKNGGGEIEEAFGFSFEPLLVRASEIAQAAEQVQAEALMLKRMRERVTLQRRELSQLIEAGLEWDAVHSWQAAYVRFREIVEAIPRRASIAQLQAILDQLSALRSELDKLLNSLHNDGDLSTNHAQNERQHIESLPESHFESNNSLSLNLVGKEALILRPSAQVKPVSKTELPSLEMVLRACPDIRDYAANGITSWRDLLDTTEIVAQFLGITPSAYREAIATMGHQKSAAVIAFLLQRTAEIKSAGGYLRSLTQKARAGELSLSAMFMSSLKARSCAGAAAC